MTMCEWIEKRREDVQLRLRLGEYGAGRHDGWINAMDLVLKELKRREKEEAESVKPHTSGSYGGPVWEDGFGDIFISLEAAEASHDIKEAARKAAQESKEK